MSICKTIGCNGKCKAGNSYCGRSTCVHLNAQTKVGQQQCLVCRGKTTKGYYCHSCVVVHCRRHICIKCAGWFPSHMAPPWGSTPTICYNCDHSPVAMCDQATPSWMLKHVGKLWPDAL
jgi:hypothetical protein